MHSYINKGGCGNMYVRMYGKLYNTKLKFQRNTSVLDIHICDKWMFLIKTSGSTVSREAKKKQYVHVIRPT